MDNDIPKEHDLILQQRLALEDLEKEITEQENYLREKIANREIHGLTGKIKYKP